MLEREGSSPRGRFIFAKYNIWTSPSEQGSRNPDPISIASIPIAEGAPIHSKHLSNISIVASIQFLKHQMIVRQMFCLNIHDHTLDALYLFIGLQLSKRAYKDR